MGAVYLAKDQRFDDSYVALKKITIEFDKLDEKQQKLFKSAFEREANLLAKLSHESIPRVTDYFSESDSQYLVMELVDGEDLGEMLAKEKKPFPVEQVVEWSYQILDALDYLHNQNPPIIHRDLKPANLKLTTRGRLKLLDFGIAKGTDGKNSNATTVTNHTFVGATLNYSPIEQLFRVIDPNYRDFIIEKFADKAINVFNQNADTRSDTFALGATFYHLTTGLLPNDALKRALDVWSGKPDPLPNPSQLNPEISPELAQVLIKSLSTDVNTRYSSATEMSAALKEAMITTNARKAKATSPKGKKSKTPVNLENLPIALNPDETQPFFPSQSGDFAEKTRIEPINNPAITQVDSLSRQSISDSEQIVPVTQVEPKLTPQETQLNNVSFTKEPQFDGNTKVDQPLSNLPDEKSNAALTEFAYLNKSEQVKAEQLKTGANEKQSAHQVTELNVPSPPSVNAATAGVSKNSMIAIASSVGIGLAILSSCVLGYWIFGGSGTSNTPANSISNRKAESSYESAPVSNTSVTNSNVSETNTNSVITTATSEPVKDEKPKEEKKLEERKPDEKRVEEKRPVSTPTPPPVKPPPVKTPVAEKPKCRKDPSDKSDDCVFDGKCRQICS